MALPEEYDVLLLCDRDEKLDINYKKTKVVKFELNDSNKKIFDTLDKISDSKKFDAVIVRCPARLYDKAIKSVITRKTSKPNQEFYDKIKLALKPCGFLLMVNSYLVDQNDAIIRDDTYFETVMLNNNFKIVGHTELLENKVPFHVMQQY